MWSLYASSNDFLHQKGSYLMDSPCFQVVAAGANPVLITRGIEKTTKALVAELKAISKEVPFSTTVYNKLRAHEVYVMYVMMD